MNDRLLGIVLCGGQSSRMGCDKATLPHPAGGTFLSHAVNRVVGHCARVCISGDQTLAARVANMDVETIVDPTRHRGPAVGIAASLRFASVHDFSACLVTPVDMPNLTRADLGRLIELWVATDSLCCAESDPDGRTEPLVAIYPTSLLAEIQMLADSNRRSVSRWIETQQPGRLRLSEASCRNVNSPQDLID